MPGDATLTDGLMFPPPHVPWACRLLAHRWGGGALRDTRPVVYMRRCHRCGYVQYGKPVYRVQPYGADARVRWERAVYRYDDYGPWPGGYA